MTKNESKFAYLLIICLFFSFTVHSSNSPAGVDVTDVVGVVTREAELVVDGGSTFCE